MKKKLCIFIIFVLYTMYHVPYVAGVKDRSWKKN